jgi:predicted ester cyclase
MSTEERKDTVRRLLEEVWNEGDLDAVDKYLATDAAEQRAPTGREYSPEAIKEDVAAFRSAFPDIRVTIDDVIAEGDKVAYRATWRGTHQGEVRGISPTSEPIAISMTGIVRLAGGKIVENWGNVNSDQESLPEVVQLLTSGDSDQARGLRWRFPPT